MGRGTDRSLRSAASALGFGEWMVAVGMWELGREGGAARRR